MSSVSVESLVSLRSRLVNYGFSISRNWAIAEDSAQDAIMAVLPKLAEFEDDARMTGYVFSTLRNKVLSGYRKAAKMTAMTDEIAESMCEPADSTGMLSYRLECAKMAMTDRQRAIMADIADGFDWMETCEEREFGRSVYFDELKKIREIISEHMVINE